MTDHEFLGHRNHIIFVETGWSEYVKNWFGVSPYKQTRVLRGVHKRLFSSNKRKTKSLPWFARKLHLGFHNLYLTVPGNDHSPTLKRSREPYRRERYGHHSLKFGLLLCRRFGIARRLRRRFFRGNRPQHQTVRGAERESDNTWTRRHSANFRRTSHSVDPAKRVLTYLLSVRR